MALTIALTPVGGSVLTPQWYIKCETVNHTFSRFPTVSPLPAQSASTPGTVFLLDLGMCVEQIAITGVIDSTSPGTGIPGKAEIEEICRNWWVYNNTPGSITPSLYPIVSIENDTTGNYIFTIKSADFRRVAAQTDRWDMSLMLLVVGKL